jgi:hypothetical protein
MNLKYLLDMVETFVARITNIIIIIIGARRSLVVKAHTTSREVAGSRTNEVKFLNLLCPGVYSASNRNEYRKH